MLAGGFVMLPFGLASVGSFSPSTSSILAWLYLVTIGSVVGYTAYTWLLANAPLGLVSTYAYVNPVVAILLGVLFRNEQVTWRILIGAAIVVSAVALVVRQGAARSPTQPEEGVPPERRGSETDDLVGPDRGARELAAASRRGAPRRPRRSRRRSAARRRP